MQRKIKDRSPDKDAASEIERVLIDPMSTLDEEEKDRQFVTALARGLELLRCFSPRESVLSNQELARKANLPRPTVSRLTYTLTRLGYLKQLPQGKYQLDVGVMSFGYGMLSNLSIRAVAHPLMEQLANHANAAVAMAARDRLQMVYLDVVHGQGNLTMRRQVGTHLPLHLSSADVHAWPACRKANAIFCWTTSGPGMRRTGQRSARAWKRPSGTTPTMAIACRSANGTGM